MYNTFTKKVVKHICTTTALLITAQFAMSQIIPIDKGDVRPYPCFYWKDRIVNKNAPLSTNEFMGVRYGNNEIFYVAKNPTGNNKQVVTRVYGSYYQNHQILNPSATPVYRWGSELRIHNNKVYYNGENYNMHTLELNSSNNWVAAMPNPMTTAEKYFAIDPGGAIYSGPGALRVMYGSLGWQNAVMDATAEDNLFEVEYADNKIYYVGYDKHIYHFYWSSTGWQWARTNNFAPEVGHVSDITYENGMLIYQDKDHLVHYITGPGSTQHGILDPSAPPAGMLVQEIDIDNGKVVYVNEDNNFHMIYKNSNGSWTNKQLSTTGDPKAHTRFDFVDGEGIAYIGNDKKLHELTRHYCIESKTDNSTSDTQEDAFVGNINELIAYPNPTSGLITIETQSTGTLSIMNINGQLVQTIVVEEENRQTIVDLTNVPSGLYFIQHQTANGTTIEKLIVE